MAAVRRKTSVTAEKDGSVAESIRSTAWLAVTEMPPLLALTIIAALFQVSWAAAYWLGGGTIVEPVWFLLPIVLAGLRFGLLGAFIAGLTAIVVAGPLLPADSATGVSQAAGSWASRGVFFMVIGGFLTYFFMAVHRWSGGAARAEAKSESEQRFRALVQRATDMITVIDAEGRLSYDSPAVERILGWAPDHRLAQLAESFVHPDDRPVAQVAWAAVIADPTRPQTIEIRLLDSAGSWHWVESTLTNLLDETTIAGIVINHRVVDERKSLQDELRHRAFHDPLTGLANRDLLRGRVEASMPGSGLDGSDGRDGRAGLVASVLFIDIDDFKNVNDGFGHDAGDRLLIEVSRRLVRCVGSAGLVARLGGDEFAVHLEESSGDALAASSVAERIIEALQVPFDVAGYQTHVSVSIGIATYFAGSTDSDAVLVQADIAMYHAKANGKNQFVFFTDEMHQGVLHRLAVESWLREALAANQFRVHYQPIVALSEQRVEAVEALIRWQHPTLGLLSPNEFIDVAEVTGLIVPLGKLVLQDACEQIGRWRSEYDEHMMVSVNLSAAQLRDHDIVEAVRDALTEAAIPAAALMIEVTEGALIGDVAGARAVLESLSALGVTIAIDDFGTGYSSLSHLQQFPVDVIKVDKSFVDGLCKSTDEATLVRSVLAIGSEFGLQVVAEGIQLREQDAELRRLGCDYGQGHYYATALPAQGVDEILGVEHALEALGAERRVEISRQSA